MLNSISVSESKYLPPELWTRILLTCPVKTLLRFRCVCKSWYSIIDDDPDFVYLHYKLCKINNTNNKLLLSLDYSSRFQEQLTVTLVEADTLENSAFIYKTSKSYIISGSCNGLLLMRRYIYSSGAYYHYYVIELSVWNPSIKKVLILPPCPLPNGSTRWGDDIIMDYELGFASNSKDYKVVAIQFRYIQETEPNKMPMAIYRLSDQQWTVINLDIGCRYFRGRGTTYSYERGFYFKGATHWFANYRHGKSKNGDKSSHLVSLDFDLEKCTFLELPFARKEKKTLRFLFVLGESLAIFSISYASSSIWMLEHDTGKAVWTLWFSGQSSHKGFKLFRYRCHLPIFYSENDGGGFICGNKFYNVTSCQVQQLNKYVSGLVELKPYSENLVLYKGFGAKDLTSLP